LIREGYIVPGNCHDSGFHFGVIPDSCFNVQSLSGALALLRVRTGAHRDLLSDAGYASMSIAVIFDRAEQANLGGETMNMHVIQRRILHDRNGNICAGAGMQVRIKTIST
jgi:hypothetical protein